MWGTFFPLISEAVTGTQASVGPPWFNRLTTPLALVLVLLTGVGPVLAWRQVTWRSLRRVLVLPLSAAGGGLRGPRAAHRRRRQPARAADVHVRGVRAHRGGPGVRARSVGAADDDRASALPRALVRLAGRNRRRYGGYLVHAGIAILFLGVAASSAFLEQRDVRLRPGQSFDVDGYQVTYKRPTAELGGDAAGTGAPISLGAVLDVRRGGDHFTLRPSRNYYSTQDPTRGAISRFFEGEATSEVDVRWGLRKDFWLAVRPDLAELDAAIKKGDRDFADSPADVQAVVIAAVVERYRRNPPPAAFRAVVSPLVVWIWIGGGIAVLGALVALWPSPEARLRRVRSLYAARLGRELSRA